MGLSRETAVRIASGFASGMRTGDTCGAVAGAIMVLGLRYGSEECVTAAGRAAVYGKVEKFIRRFRERNKFLLCRDLLGVDTSTSEGLAKAKELNLFRTMCPALVGDAAAILEEMEKEAE
ncbi:MAG: C_GCAxxG_C_C family protein [Aminivibrio sp.]|nr:C_GCAxxG_C_C family protein [Aminivibrio sp.]